MRIRVVRLGTKTSEKPISTGYEYTGQIDVCEQDVCSVRLEKGNNITVVMSDKQYKEFVEKINDDRKGR